MGSGFNATPSETDEVGALRAEIERLRERAERAEKELRESQALHAATVESLPFDFWARDREGYCFSQNATARANWGDLLGKRPEDMNLPPSVLEAWLLNNRRALAGEIVHGDQNYLLGGEARHIHNILAPIRMGDAVVGTLGVNVDITERVHAVQALRESEEKLRLAADASGIGFYSWNLQIDEIHWEASLCGIFGLASGTGPRTGEGFLALIHPEDRARVEAELRRGVASEGREDEYRVLRADGAVRWVLTKGSVLRDATRHLVLGAVLDVTERRQRNERLRQSQKLEAVGQLTAGIAHNFNNMLMGVLPNLELAARDAPEDIVPQLRAAQQSAQRAANLVRQLMMAAGRNRATTRSVEPVGPLVERAVELCRTTFDRHIVLDARYDAEARACVDAVLIEQAVLNLLINARDALSPLTVRPRITVGVDVVRASAPELEGRVVDHVRIRVQDNGVGMSAATVARIYEPFFTTKELGKGTGLGLATTHAIVREHGGFVTCESAPDQGATFSLYLPCDAPPADDAPVDASPAAAVRGTETVLVVDDEAPIRAVISQILGAAGFSSRVAASGDEAVALLADPRIAAEVALVLLDVSMPGMPRAELRARLRELVPHARVVNFTGYAFEAPESGDAVLEKPVTTEKLLRTIREVLDRPATPKGT